MSKRGIPSKFTKFLITFILGGGRLERQWSHPNLRPRPHPASGLRDATGGSISACGRRLPKTPSQPPGTIIVIENVLPGMTHITLSSSIQAWLIQTTVLYKFVQNKRFLATVAWNCKNKL